MSCIAIDATLLEIALTWSNTGNLEVGEVDQQVPTDGDWVLRLLQLRTFSDLPAANLQAMFLKMETVETVPGQIVIRQGEPGDYFYVVAKGRCEVVRESVNRKPVLLAHFGAGECFGEESLISGAPRNATVKALDQGSLLRLEKSDFRQLLNDPLTRLVSLEQANTQIASGSAQWLDVRLPSETGRQSPPGSAVIPVYMLRMRADELDRGQSYICVCDNGQRAMVAAYLLRQKGYETYVLEGGLA